jgi:hypothetical protein
MVAQQSAWRLALGPVPETADRIADDQNRSNWRVRSLFLGRPLLARTRRLESTDSVDKPGLLAAATTNRIKGLLFSQGASGV